jgi:hypothetical protein
MDVLAVSGWVMTAASLGVAAVQTYRNHRLAHRNRDQMTLFIEDANYVSFEHELIDEMAKQVNDPMLLRFLVSSHQRGCDLYRGLVDYYLSQVRSFTYKDLLRICGTQLVTYKWQEEFWKGRLALRRENRKTPVPSESYLAENKSARFKALKMRDSAKRE